MQTKRHLSIEIHTSKFCEAAYQTKCQKMCILVESLCKKKMYIFTIIKLIFG